MIVGSVCSGILADALAWAPLGWAISGNVSPALSKSSLGMGMGSTVRRLTPVECERLMGMPDGYTAISMPGRKRGAARIVGYRYAALGNSIAVTKLRWIGRRIQLVDEIARSA